MIARVLGTGSGDREERERVRISSYGTRFPSQKNPISSNAILYYRKCQHWGEAPHSDPVPPNRRRPLRRQVRLRENRLRNLNPREEAH